MTKIVPDTNIIISSIFWRGLPYNVIKKGILRKYQLVISNAILDEVVDKLRNKFNFPEESIQKLVDILLTHCLLVEPNSKFNAVRDNKDNKVIECAFDAKADYIVTGDKDLLELKEFKGIKIMKAKEFLEEFG